MSGEASDIEDQLEEQQLTAQNQFPWLDILSKAAINMVLPLINGMCLGFGEIFAHELCVVWGWRQARVFDPRDVVSAKRRSWLWPI